MLDFSGVSACPFGAVGVVDSGVGGISTLGALATRLPCEDFIYLADRAGAPYGNKSAGYILARTAHNVVTLASMGAKAVVVACNTATNVAIAALRESERFKNLTLIGVEPAIKPAIQNTKQGKILVLLTPAAAKTQKFRALTQQFDPTRLIISPQKNLAKQIEQALTNCKANPELYATKTLQPTSNFELKSVAPELYAVLSNCKGVSAVVLGCTHYVFLSRQIAEFYGGRVAVYDGNQGTAARLVSALAQKNLLNPKSSPTQIQFVTT